MFLFGITMYNHYKHYSNPDLGYVHGFFPLESLRKSPGISSETAMPRRSELLHVEGFPHLFHLLIAEAIARADAAGPQIRHGEVTKTTRKWQLSNISMENIWKTIWKNIWKSRMWEYHGDITKKRVETRGITWD